jgi:DNA-binding SARP family transcriptional activator
MDRRSHEVDRLSRARLRQLIADAASARVCTVVAPAGFGKSTFLADLIAHHNGPAIDIRVATTTVAAGSLLDQIDTRFEAFGATEPGTQRRVIALDDVHLAAGTPLLGDLQLLCSASTPYPDALVVFAGRLAPPVDLSRHRLEGALVEITASDLRFRSWEVEDLFTRVYRVRFPPSELAAVAAATDGWAAGLQLYRHATQRSTESLRRQQLDRLRQSRLETIRSYLASNVLSTLDDDVRRFAVDAAVLGRMEVRTCNRLLDRIDSQRCLDRLVELQLFTECEHDGSYRFHEVFRSYLEAELAAEVPPAELATRYHAAGVVLEESGALVDALRAYGVAGRDCDLTRVLTQMQTQACETDSSSHAHWFGQPWVISIPSGLLADQGLRLARARSLIRAGRPQGALGELHAIARDATAADVARAADREHARLRRWIDPTHVRFDPDDWTSSIRLSLLNGAADRTLRHPPETDQSSSAIRGLVTGWTALIEGDPVAAVRSLDGIDHSTLDRLCSDVAAAGVAIGWWLIDGLDPSDVLAGLRDDADRDHRTWEARLLRAVLLAFPLPDDPPIQQLFDSLHDEATRAGDEWTVALASCWLLIGAAAGNLRPIDLPCVSVVADRAHSIAEGIGANVLGVWSLAARWLAAQQLPIAAPSDAEKRWAEATPCRLLDLVREADATALTRVLPDDDDGRNPMIVLLSGAASRGHHHSQWSEPADVSPSPKVHVRLLGSFEVVVNGKPVALDALRPRARSVLRMLALSATQPVHRDRILEAMWPDADPATASKRLHVAVSSIRHALGEAAVSLVRSGDAYMLGTAALPVTSDVAGFDEAVRDLDKAVQARDCDAAEIAAKVVTASYSGELLAEEGAADWVEGPRRDRLRAYLTATAWLTEQHAKADNWAAVIDHAEAGLRHDRYADELWTRLLDGLARCGRTAEHERAKQNYADVLSDLGVAS